MRDIEHLQHGMHAKLPTFRRKLDKARAIIDEALAINVKWSLSFSGGIDSTVLLDLLSDAHLTTHFGDDGADYAQTLQFLSDTEQRYGFELRRIRCLEPWRDWCAEMGRSDLIDAGPAMNNAWLNPHQWHSTWQSLKDASHYGYGGVFLGLLASESRSRNYALKSGHKPLYQTKEDGMWHCSPLASWTKQDIWAYAVSHHLHYNNVYDKLAELDISLQHRRVGPLTCFRIMHYGTHGHVLKHVDYELYNKLSNVFPKIREYS